VAAQTTLRNPVVLRKLSPDLLFGLGGFVLGAFALLLMQILEAHALPSAMGGTDRVARAQSGSHFAIFPTN